MLSELLLLLPSLFLALLVRISAYNIKAKADVPKALLAYQNSRKDRAEYIQQVASQNTSLLHLPDGPDQVARDAKFAEFAQSPDEPSPDRWADAEFQRFLFEYDAERAAKDALSSM
jgi:salicylate hydroxylase